MFVLLASTFARGAIEEIGLGRGYMKGFFLSFHFYLVESPLLLSLAHGEENWGGNVKT